VLKKAPTWERRFSKRLLPARKPALLPLPNFNMKWYSAEAGETGLLKKGDLLCRQLLADGCKVLVLFGGTDRWKRLAFLVTH